MDREKLKAELYDRAMMGDSTAALAYAVLDLQASHSVGRSERKPAAMPQSGVVTADDMGRFLDNIRAGRDDHFYVETDELRKQYADFIGMAEDGVPNSIFAKVLKQVDPSVRNFRPRKKHGRSRCYYFSPRDKHRDLI